MEQLEDRNQPSTITAGSEQILYTAGSGVQNQVTITPAMLEEGKLTITDSAEEITSVPMNWIKSPDNHSATGPYSAQSFVNVDAGDGDDQVVGTTSPVFLIVTGKEGNDVIYGSGFNDELFGGERG